MKKEAKMKEAGIDAVTRRGVLRGLLTTGVGCLIGRSAAVEAPKTGDAAATRWERGQFQVHFIYTGVAESVFIIFPDGTSMLLDCGDGPSIMRKPYNVPVPRPCEMAGETVANYVLGVNPRGSHVDYMVVSHFHADHIGTPNWQNCGVRVDKSEGRYWRSGFGIALEKLHFSKAIDRGFPTYDDPIPFVGGIDRELEHMRRIYDFLRERDGLKVEKFQVGSNNQIRMLHGGTEDFRVRNLAANGKVVRLNGSVQDLTRDFISKHPGARLDENYMSIGMVFESGDFRFYTGGDLMGWNGLDRAVADVVGRVDVAKMNHHGCYSMSQDLVAALRAKCYVGCVWCQLHALDETMKRLSDRSFYPGERFLFPTVLTAERRAKDRDKPWFADVSPGVSETGVHVVLTVQPGGKRYSVECVDASDDRAKVLSRHWFEARCEDGCDRG